MSDQTTRRFSRLALIGAAMITVAALGIRSWRNDVANAPSTEVAAAPVAQPPVAQADVAAAIGALEAKLKANPDDAASWNALGLAFYQGGRFAEAATAYRRATTIAPNQSATWSSLGEALVMAGPGTVPADAKSAFTKAVALDPKDPRARYFLGVAQDLAGDHDGAIGAWIALLKDTPVGAPWEADVRRTVEAVGKKNNIDVAGRLAALRAASPTSATPAPGEQEAMIAGMVGNLAAKLKAEPKNVEGWIMLMRSYTALGRRADAAAAYRSATSANPGAKAALAEAARTMGVT